MESPVFRIESAEDLCTHYNTMYRPHKLLKMNKNEILTVFIIQRKALQHLKKLKSFQVSISKKVMQYYQNHPQAYISGILKICLQAGPFSNNMLVLKFPHIDFTFD